MFSKKNAQIFFFGGTFLSFAVFIGLSWHSIAYEIPKQTNSAAITEDVVRGKRIWEKNNCMSCHTLLGEGAYYAPELTKVIERRGPEMIKSILKSPTPWGPRGRLMVAYNMSEQDANDVIAFLTWCGNIDLNGFPPKPVLSQPTKN